MFSNNFKTNDTKKTTHSTNEILSLNHIDCDIVRERIRQFMKENQLSQPLFIKHINSKLTDKEEETTYCSFTRFLTKHGKDDGKLSACFPALVSFLKQLQPDISLSTPKRKRGFPKNDLDADDLSDNTNRSGENNDEDGYDPPNVKFDEIYIDPYVLDADLPAKDPLKRLIKFPTTTPSTPEATSTT